jgi:DHA2 family multidrug resistance protein
MKPGSVLIIVVAVMASLLEIIDTSIVNVALPSMMGNLGATLEDISMVITGYAIANAIVLPVSAWLGERIGRRTYFLGCILMFTIASVLCGIAPNLECLIVFRIFQGLAGGALLPTSQTLIYEQFPKEKAGMAGALFGMSVMIGPTLGPTLGGFLTDQYGWRMIFNVNLPLGIIALMIGYAVIQNPDYHRKSSEEKRPLDSVGLALLVMGVGCLQYVLERGEADDWFSSHAIVVNAIIAVLSLPSFIWWELKTEHPIINVRLFKEGIVSNGVLLMACLGFFLYGLVFMLPVFLNRMYGYDATQIGMMFIPGSLITAMLMPMVGQAMQKRVNPKILIFVGLTSIELCLLMMSRFSPLSPPEEIYHMLYMRGFALAFLFVPINSSILSQFSGPALGQVAGLLNLFRQIGGSMGIALVATLLNMRSHQNFLDLVSKVSLLNPSTEAFYHQLSLSMAGKMNQSVGFAAPQSAALKILTFKIQNQVFMISFLQLVWTMMGIFSLVFIPYFLLKLKRPATAVLDAH